MENGNAQLAAIITIAIPILVGIAIATIFFKLIEFLGAGTKYFNEKTKEMKRNKDE